MSYEEMIKALSDIEKLKEDVFEWGKKEGLEDMGEINELMPLIDDYLKHYIVAPERWESDETNKIKSPWQLLVLGALQEHLKYTENEIMNMPLSKSLALYATVGEMHGDDNLMSEKEAEINKKMEDK